MNKQTNITANGKQPPKKKFPREKNYDDEVDEEEGAEGEGGSEEEDEYGDEDGDGSGNDGGAQGGAVGYCDDDHWFSDSSASDGGAGGEERQPRLVMYAAWTQYDVVKEVGKNVFGYHLTKND